ncbi:MAG: hypothetical protein AAFQ66_01105 [Pseudomonadota bacterium]
MRDEPKQNFRRPFGAMVGTLAAAVMVIGGLIFANPSFPILKVPARLELAEAPIPVAHPLGGILEQLAVEPGSSAEIGKPLLVLDDTAPAAAHKLNEERWWAAQVRLARLEAELQGADHISDLIDKRLAIPQSIEPIIDRQTSLMQARTHTRETRSGHLSDHIAYLQDQIAAVRKSPAPNADLLDSLQAELERTDTQRSALHDRFLASVEVDIELVQAELLELDKHLFETKSVLDTLSLSAPSTGIVRLVRDLEPGATIEAGEVLLELLPSGADPVVRFNLSEADRPKVHLGDTIRMSPADDGQDVMGRVAVIEPLVPGYRVTATLPPNSLSSGQDVQAIFDQSTLDILTDLLGVQAIAGILE